MFTNCTNWLSDGEICQSCQEELEKAALESLKNFGAPDVIGCSECGQWYYREEFLNHLPCNEHA